MEDYALLAEDNCVQVALLQSLIHLTGQLSKNIWTDVQPPTNLEFLINEKTCIRMRPDTIDFLE